MKTYQLLSPFILATLPFLSLGTLADEPMVHDAWIRAMPPTARVVPVYLSLHNPTNRELQLTAIGSPRGDIELHQTLMNEDMMSMLPVDSIRIPPHEMLKLEPGGYHGMMSHFSGAVPALGDSVPLILQLADGEQLHATARVIAQTSAVDHGMHHADHGRAPMEE